MKTAYSCLVDGGPKFEWQAVNLCSSLMRNASIRAEDIKVHVTPTVSEAFRSFVEDRGMKLVFVDSFPGNHGYCNKIQQMFSSAFSGYQKVVLCDCDLYFMRPIDVDRLGAPMAGRQVDRPNPPLTLLRKLYEQRAIAPSSVKPVGFPVAETEQTLASNWNGGLYVFDVDHLHEWGEVWSAHAQWMLENIGVLGEYRNHVDQISLALTIDELLILTEAIPSNHNYPIHFDGAEVYDGAPSVIESFHYHHRMDLWGRISYTGSAKVDRQIDDVNRNIREIITNNVIRDDALFELFQSWQRYCRPSSSSDWILESIAAFQNPRYIRHNARRFEHLASLKLDIFDKTVLEFGAGIGDHSLFFLDRGCHVTSIEPRAKNVECILHRHKTETDAFPSGRHRVVQCDEAHSDAFIGQARFQILYNYGLLYHLKDPEGFIRRSAAYCEGIYLLETAVQDFSDSVCYIEDAENLTNAVDGDCLILSRRNIFNILRDCFPYVYMPRTQPAHEQFLLDWSTPPNSRAYRHRAIFVGSTTPILDPIFADRVIDRHDR